MSLTDEKIDYLNKRISLAKNLVWASGLLFAGTVAVAGWTWKNITSEFVRFDQDLRIQHAGSTDEVFLIFSEQRDASGRHIAAAGTGVIRPLRLVKP